MRSLELNEVKVISGGAEPNNGYNFSFIVENGVFVGILAVIGGYNFLHGVAIGAGYAALRLTAKVTDNYFFPTTEQ